MKSSLKEFKQWVNERMPFNNQHSDGHCNISSRGLCLCCALKNFNGYYHPYVRFEFLIWCCVTAAQKPDVSGLAEFLKPLNEVVMKANSLTEGKPSEFFNHLKTAAGSLAALFWIAYTGKGCGEWNFCFLLSFYIFWNRWFCSTHHLFSLSFLYFFSYFTLFSYSIYEPSNCSCGRKLANGWIL